MRSFPIALRALVWVLISGCLSHIGSAAAQDSAPRDGLTVFAAASLTDTLQRISDAYTARSGAPIRLSFAASSALARQIEAGARVDVYFSADQEWMDYLERRQLIDASTREDLLGNRLALIAPKEGAVRASLTRSASIMAALGGKGRLATGDPDSVPAGKYAKAALISLGLWKVVEPRLARAENVRVALSYVARGEAPLGIVYATDAAVEPRVRIVELFPETSHAPITYPVAAVASARPNTSEYLAFLRSPEARRVFVAAGFEVLATQ
jgi:molybdate transport system substrate-binding protein